jgi:DNA-binding MarR family transcriptional regulator
MENDKSIQIVRGVLSLVRRLRAEQPPSSTSLAGVGVLSTLWRLGPMPAARLAGEERLQPQSLTRLISSLERADLISRSPSKTDGREIVISVTPRGLETLSANMSAHRRWLEQAMAETLNDAERKVLLEASGAMIKLAGYDGGQSSMPPDEINSSERFPGCAAKRDPGVTK